MKVTISVNLGGLAFVVDEDAYARLQAYLEEISRYFRTLGDGGEVVADIEARLAEQLQARLAEGRREVVSLADVEAMVKAMGTVADISGESGAGENPAAAAAPREAASQRPRRLYRDTDDVIIAGVCSGIAAYFGIDPLLVRLGFIASIFFGGVGFIIYFLLWALVPPAVTAAEKFEMRGETVTLENWRERMQDKAETIGVSRSRLSGGLQRVGRGLDRLLRFAGLVIVRLGSIFAALVGVCLMIVGALAVAFLVFAVITLAGPQSNYYFDFPLRTLVPAWLFWTLLLSAAWLALVPLLVLVQTGTTLLRRKSTFRLLPTVALFGTWVLAGAILASSVLQTIPNYETRANDVQKVEDLPSVTVTKQFHALRADRIERIIIERGPEAKAVLRGPASALERFQLNVRDGILILDNVKGEKPCLFCLPRHGLAELVVTAPSLDDVDVSLAREVIVRGFEGERLKVAAMSLDSLTLSGLKIDRLDLTAGNVDTVTLSGEGKEATIAMNSYSPAALHAFTYPVAKLALQLRGEVVAEVQVSKSLEVKSDGRGRVDLRGKAAVTELPLPTEGEPNEAGVIINGESKRMSIKEIDGPDDPIAVGTVTDRPVNQADYQVGTVKIHVNSQPGTLEISGGGDSESTTMTVTKVETASSPAASPSSTVVHRVE